MAPGVENPDYRLETQRYEYGCAAGFQWKPTDNCLKYECGRDVKRLIEDLHLQDGDRIIITVHKA